MLSMSQMPRSSRRWPMLPGAAAPCCSALFGLYAIERYAEASLAAAEQRSIQSAEVAAYSLARLVERKLVERRPREISDAGRVAVFEATLIEAAGTAIWSTVSGRVAVDASERDHVAVHRDGGAGPVVGVPAGGLVTAGSGVHFSRRILTPDGEVDGAVVVLVDPVGLAARLGDMPITGGGVAAPLRDDGGVLAHTDGPGRFIGRRIAADHFEHLDAALASARNGAASLSDLGLRDREVFTAARPIAGRPLIVVYSTGRNARHAAARADAARQELAVLLDALPGVASRAAFDAAGRLCRVELSPGAARLAGSQEFDREVARPRLLLHTQRLAFLERLLVEGEAVTEVRLEVPAPEARWLRDDARLARRHPAGSTSIIGILADITAERTLQADVHSVAKLATLGEMATGIAHEFSQRFAAIGLAADLAPVELVQGGPEAVRRVLSLLDDIAANTTRLCDLIDHFRAFARRDGAAPDGLAVDETVRGAIVIVRGAFHTAGIRIELDLAPGRPRIRGRLLAMPWRPRHRTNEPLRHVRGRMRPAPSCVSVSARWEAALPPSISTGCSGPSSRRSHPGVARASGPTSRMERLPPRMARLRWRTTPTAVPNGRSDAGRSRQLRT